MTLREVTDYLMPALRGLGMECTVDASDRLDVLLGFDPYQSYQHIELTEEHKNLYRALAGPHAHTVLKMWRIKKGLEYATEVETNCAHGG